MEGGLCYFHANPDKAAELGRNGGRHRKHTYEQAPEQIAPPASAADVKRMLAEFHVLHRTFSGKVINLATIFGRIVASDAVRHQNGPL